MTACWEQRGCDAEMQGRCPHNAPGESCPVECHFAVCERPTHEVCQSIELLLNPQIDYEACVKEGCRICTFFLSKGPRLAEGERAARRQGNPNRFIL